ncbi:hypothetical protein BH11PSE11_BH11PSE11_04110 [soil metagenome]
MRALFLAVVTALSMNIPAAFGADGSAPILRIESGNHSAPIRAIAVDAAGRYAVTASEDKTARVWEVSSGRLQQVLRPPIGAGNDGKLYAAAISPQGDLIATGGWSASNDVYVFQRTSGQLIHRVTGLPNVITHLAFSPNGRLLAVSMFGKNGIRLFASNDGWQSSREAALDSEYGSESYGADFSSDGKRFVTSSFDGAIRLYDTSEGQLRLLHSAKAPGGNRPFSVMFSPDGKKIAVGFADRAAVTVLNTENLSQAYSPSVAGIDNGDLSALSWSADGLQLYAAGSWKRGDAQHGLRRWNDSGQGSHVDSTIARNSIVALQPLRDGRVLFAATDPAWGVASTTPEKSAGEVSLADFRGNRDAFRIAPDGSGIGFGYAFGRSDAAGFDILKMAVSAPGARWSVPVVKNKTLLVEQWFQNARPVLNQRPLRLEPDEISMSAAVNSSGTNLALGTSFNVRYFNREGVEQWHVAAPGTTWQVNLSADGRWLIAGFSDGTIRWYRTRDGAEQLALLPHADRKRWVAWTPQGYYAASVSGEDLIGWHVNRGNERAADFFPGSRFRSTFYRPDVIELVLTKGDVDAAVQAANAEAGRKTEVARVESRLPPVVNVLSPGNGESTSSKEVKVRVSVRAPADAPAVSLRVRINGRIVDLPESRSLNTPTNSDRAEQEHVLRIPMPEQDAEIMIFAENKHGFSTPAVLKMRWTGAQSAAATQATPPVQAAAPTPAPSPAAAPPQTAKTAPPPALPPGSPDLRPNLYVLAVGVSQYKNPAIRLDYAAKDAGDFAAAFKAQEGGLYRKVVIKSLTNENAKRDDILDGLEWIRRELTSRDVGIVFLAGHGVNDNDGVYYYLPQDVDVDKLKRTGIIFTEIKNTLSALPGKALFFVDTCHAGNILGTGRRGIKPDLTGVVNELTSAENGVIVFAASTGRQESAESPEWRNGAFTKSVVEGVGGKADSMRSGRVTHKMLDLYASERVKELTKGVQSPVTIVPQGIPDFPLAVAR